MSHQPQDTTVLMATLELAVPLRIAELEAMTSRLRGATIEAWRTASVEAIASRGDILQYKGGRKGQTAQVFNDLARGLAVLAHTPGGVLFSGMHWCLEHPGGVRADRITDLGCTLGWEQPEPLPTTRRTVTVTAPDIL